MRKAWSLLVGVVVVALAMVSGGAVSAEAEKAGPALQLAWMETPLGTTLDDILTGRAQPGFTPVLSQGLPFSARQDRVLWVRIRTELPEAADWHLDVNRVPLDRLRLRARDGSVLAEDSFFARGPEIATWPAVFDLPLPPGLSGPIELYLETQGTVMGGLHLAIRRQAESDAREAEARRYFRWVYGLLLLVAVLSLVRHMEDPQCGALAVGAAAFCSWLACLGINGHLYSLPEIALLSGRGAAVPQALFLLGAGPLVLATRHYAGISRSAPRLSVWSAVLGWLLVLAALYGLFMVEGHQAAALQWIALAGYALALAACLLMLLLDSRGYRWGPVLALLAMAAAVAARLLADRQWLPAGLASLYGWQALLALAMMLYLGLPWMRARMQRWAARKRAVPPEPSLEEKIEAARQRLMQSLQAGLEHADDDDMTWIAYRRLLDGLKSVLPQQSSAVVGLQPDGEPLMFVTPPDAEPRYRQLLEQRATLVRNLSKLKAPQQVGMDFDGPEGPLEKVQLAVIPLPIPKPGWGALLVERPAELSYSEAELALCAEFAAMASMAGEEAAGAIGAQRAADTDPATGTFRAEVARELLQERMAKARLKQQPLSLLYFVLDQLPALREAGGEVGAVAGLRPLAELLRDEMAHGDLLGRSGPDGFLLVAHGKRLAEAREYADRLRAAVQRMPVDPRVAPFLTVSVGIAQAGADDRDATALADRAGRAAHIASKNGGNQIFS
ncbi:diguanylate cyclase [Arenimonas fontis]|uniref:diguanylate cyclase n=1 Tax=Arenimonas fontis TaxID=2608255 RepID=A0A5B2Z8H3_9GAMM|nr:diguanylate cyclase [Arenimonas fontis]KAA2284197.1 diguanylate cyclase [Arenimonas fontis]